MCTGQTKATAGQVINDAESSDESFLSKLKKKIFG
jgi:hypothetical protein